MCVNFGVQLQQRILAVDLGEARVGVAISDELRLLAHPLETIHLRAGESAIERVAKIASSSNVAEIIIGMPRNMDGSYGPAAEKANAFSEVLKTKVTCDVKLWDERLSTVAAQKVLRASGRDAKKGRAVIDQVAAQIFLQSYLDSRAQQ